MLAELRIENLAVISSAEMIFSPGLNAVTGETGAGKTILAMAITLLLGVRAGGSLIRPGADEASVDAVFTVPEGFFADLAAELDIPEEEDIIVRRRISRDGRSRAYLNGRATTLGVLEQVTGRMLAFSAQHEQRRLMMASRQLEILDAYAGPRLGGLKEEFGVLFERRARLIARLQNIGEDAEARQREAELLAFQAAEIESAGISGKEDEDLESERRRLSAAGELKDAAAELARLLGAGEASADFMELMSASMERLKQAEEADKGLEGIASRLEACFFELEDLARAARGYSDSVIVDPERLAEVEERLDLIGGLKRKYGGTIEDILAYAAEARDRLAGLEDVGAERPRLEEELQAIESRMIDAAMSMRALRIQAAGELALEAAEHMEDLAFGRCLFDIRLSPNEGDDGPLEAGHLTGSGADSVEFFISPNPGMPATPIRDAASGGELSRIMLAIKSSVSAGGDAATLVFDEIDAGIGGETGAAVGAKLKELAGESQVICITHLPQIACQADAHFSVVKDTARGKTATHVLRLEEQEITDELCRMMGSRPDDPEARAHAESLIQRTGGKR